MGDSKELDLDTMMEDLSDRLEEMLEDICFDAMEDHITNTIQDMLPEAISEALSNYEFVLPDGTVARPKQQMKLMSPDKTRMVVCHGGLRVDGRTLVVQTRISSWESIACYQSREEAIEALGRVKNAMEANVPVFEL